MSYRFGRQSRKFIFKYEHYSNVHFLLLNIRFFAFNIHFLIMNVRFFFFSEDMAYVLFIICFSLYIN